MKADHKKVKHQLAIARGQIDGVMRMVDEDAYCLEVSDQILATIAVLKRLNNMVIAAHLRACVMESKNDENANKKLEEMEKIMRRMSQ